jgi:hypothetical protein
VQKIERWCQSLKLQPMPLSWSVQDRYVDASSSRPPILAGALIRTRPDDATNHPNDSYNDSHEIGDHERQEQRTAEQIEKQIPKRVLHAEVVTFSADFNATLQLRATRVSVPGRNSRTGRE